MEKQKLYTLGYTLFQNGAVIDIKEMFKILKEYNVTHLVDVRSMPYSKQYPQCNADNLKVASKYFSISYGHMPELGAKASPIQDVFSIASDIFFESIFPISKSNRPEGTELMLTKIVDFQNWNDEYFPWNKKNRNSTITITLPFCVVRKDQLTVIGIFSKQKIEQSLEIG